MSFHSDNSHLMMMLDIKMAKYLMGLDEILDEWNYC